MITAINKKGMVSKFSDKVWNMMPKHKNGWEEIGAAKGLSVPPEVTEFMAKKKDVAAEEKKVEIPDITIDDGQPTDRLKEAIEMQEMRKYLTDKGIPVHHKIGYAKLKALYDDHSK